MAQVAHSVPENVPGEFWVDSSCIDCDACRQIAPSVFADAGNHSFVTKQPARGEERSRALMALVACPTASIGTHDKKGTREAMERFPEVVSEEVSFCGFCSESSFGASSYFIRRSGGNVLVDSPRAAEPLMKKLSELGGVSHLFLTHRDDVADEARFHERFGCERIMHEADAFLGVERVIRGREPVTIAPDLTVIPVPGHTRGSACLLYRDKFLFTGDHLWADEAGELAMGRGVCWYSWPEQVESLRRLLDFEFEWVLPGHMRRYASPSMRADIEKLLAKLRK
jgi:glyoxylase-like metal-dependent hydrolase (beta-lactamase superfamily II)/ferredoxin